MSPESTLAHSWFITGTDTEIGKTLIASSLLHALGAIGVKAAGMKPIAAGATERNGVLRNDDADQLAQAATVALSPALATPYLLRAAAAPHVAARLEQIEIDVRHVQQCFTRIVARAEAVVVEGVGGFRVPLSLGVDTADLAQQLGLPMIMVVGLRLGCINHALLTAEAIAARGLTLAGWVCNVVDPDMLHAQGSVDALIERLPAPLLGAVPRLPVPDAASAAQHIDFTLLPNWPRRKPPEATARPAGPAA
ncbi:MAG: dethiobiotin synthase [Herminiimonas sp.]|nr:dethiobiotin synthase [Herminiimonas sp.]